MIQIMNIADLIGKTVHDVCEADKVILTFADDTYAIFTSNNDETVSLRDWPVSFFDGDVKHYVRLGIFSQAEYDAHLEKQKTDWERTQDSRDRQEYERLKSKFATG